MIELNSSEEVLKNCIELLKKYNYMINFVERCEENCPKELYQICPYNRSHSLYDSKKLFEIIRVHNRKEKLRKLLA